MSTILISNFLPSRTASVSIFSRSNPICLVGINKRTEIIQWKQAQEEKIKSMELIDLYYLNVNLL